jgi:hypothetical protein
MSSNEQKILGPEVGYVDILNFATVEHLKKEAEKGPQYSPLRPSASGKCTRELAYELTEYAGIARYEKEVITPETHRIFALGHSVEWHILKQLEQHTGEYFKVKYKQQGLSFFKLEATNKPELSQWLEGSIDACFYSPSHRAVIDFKSKKDKYSSYHKSSWDETTEKLSNMESVQMIGDSGTSFWAEDLEAFLKELDDPFFEANFLQLNLYANSQFLMERGVDHGAIIQINKNDSRLREVRFKPSRALYEKTKAKFEAALAAVDAGDPELAPRDHLLGSIKCAFCSFKKHCWRVESDEDPLKSYFKTLPKKGWPTDLNRLDAGSQQLLGEAYEAFKASQEASEKTEVVEKEIIDAMLKANVRKVRFGDGKIYEIKTLKDGIVLRRGKL